MLGLVGWGEKGLTLFEGGLLCCSEWDRMGDSPV